eukprot:m.150940 g.150940  ORF g.150940 m.150940 type:complete len:207 (+) comp10148_c0_seq6:1479-2099(+)
MHALVCIKTLLVWSPASEGVISRHTCRSHYRSCKNYAVQDRVTQFLLLSFLGDFLRSRFFLSSKKWDSLGLTVATCLACAIFISSQFRTCRAEQVDCVSFDCDQIIMQILADFRVTSLLLATVFYFQWHFLSQAGLCKGILWYCSIPLPIISWVASTFYWLLDPSTNVTSHDQGPFLQSYNWARISLASTTTSAFLLGVLCVNHSV